MMRLPNAVLTLLIWLCATAAFAGEPFVEIPASREQLEAVRQGGFVLYLRHGHTDNTRQDRVPGVDLSDCSTQRLLSEEGRRAATTVGQFIRKARLPIQDIHISPLCRVKDTLAAAFPKAAHQVDPLLMYVANLTSEQKVPVIERTRQLLSLPVKPKENRLLIAHAPNLMELIGYFPKEATLIIFRPLGTAGGFEYVGSIVLERWPELVR